MNRLVPPRRMTASGACKTHTSPGTLCIPNSSPSAFPVPDKVHGRSLRGKVTHRGEPRETRGRSSHAGPGRMRTDCPSLLRAVLAGPSLPHHLLKVDSARLGSMKFLRIRVHTLALTTCVANLMQKPRPAAPDGAFHGACVRPSSSRANGGEKPAQCASGSGRTWKCTAMGLMPLPPSWSHGVRSPLDVHRPRPFQPALGSSMRPSRPLA
jgi:hypothetical protein